MASLLKVLGGPRHLLTNEHWLHLTFAWYHVISEHLVQPALERGEIVIADSWFYKPLVRFGLIEAQLFDKARRLFDALVQPDQVCLLEIDPESAAARKTKFGFGETGPGRSASGPRP